MPFIILFCDLAFNQDRISDWIEYFRAPWAQFFFQDTADDFIDKLRATLRETESSSTYIQTMTESRESGKGIQKILEDRTSDTMGGVQKDIKIAVEVCVHLSLFLCSNDLPFPFAVRPENVHKGHISFH